MLKSIHIKSFRSCHDLHLENIGSLLVLVGRNGAGKSNIMKGIDWLARAASSPLNEHNNSNGEASAEFFIGNDLYRYSIKRNSKFGLLSLGILSGDKSYIEELAILVGEDFKPLILRENETVRLVKDAIELSISEDISAFLAVQSLLPEEYPLKQLLKKIITFFNGIRYYPLNNIEDGSEQVFIKFTDYQSWVIGKNTLSFSAEIIYKLLDLFIKYPEKYTELTHILGCNGLSILNEIKIKHFTVSPNNDIEDEEDQAENIEDADSKYYFVRFSPKGHNEKAAFSFSDLSFGTQRIIQFIVSLLYDASSVSLIEQLEDGIHEGLLDKLIPLLRANSDNSQFIIASHSSVIFNRIKPREVRIIELNEGVTSARALNENEVQAAEQYLKEDGPFSDFLRMD